MKKEDMKGEIIRHAIVNALGTSVYVIVVACFMYIGGAGAFGKNASVFIPIAILMLFVFSAAFTGFLMFGRPIMWYLDGKKKEALSLLLYTLGFFLFITLIALLLLIGFSN